MRFEFATATRILFGPGTARDLPSLVAGFGRRALWLTGSNSQRADPLRSALVAERIETVPFVVATEPTTHLVVQGAKKSIESKCDMVVAVGGGSVLDGGKAIAALAANPGELLEYLEVIGRGRPIENPPLPFIAVPTTAGTGTEVTRNAVLTSPEGRVKASLRSPLLLARLAVIDPELAFGLPAALTASTGLDALTQLIEPYVSCRANPMTDGFCQSGISRVKRSLRQAYRPPDDRAAREDMAMASLLSGLALANAGLGIVHGFAAPIGGMFTAPHGAVCAALLPHAMEINIRALRKRDPSHVALTRFDEIARWLTGQGNATAMDGVSWVRELVSELGIPSLQKYGITPGDVASLCEKAAQASSTKGNPLALETPELAEIFEKAL
jgi:alcohol dehydrogenase class IV